MGVSGWLIFGLCEFVSFLCASYVVALSPFAWPSLYSDVTSLLRWLLSPLRHRRSWR